VLHQIEIAQDGCSLSPAELWLKTISRSILLPFLHSTGPSLDRDQNLVSYGKGMLILSCFTCILDIRKREKKLPSWSIMMSHEAKADLVDEFYDTLLGHSSDRNLTINLEQLGIPTHDLAALDEPFSQKEVRGTVK
jgi:hypothetical protein